MPLINLIQEQRATRRKTEGKARTLFFAFIGISVCSVVGVGSILFRVQGLESEEASLRAQVQKLAPTVKRIEEDEKALAALAPRLQTLEDAQATTDKWTTIFDHLTKQTPRKTWLTAIRCTASDPTKPIQVSFVGLSEKQELVGEFIMRLQNCAALDTVALKYTQEKLAVQSTCLEFEIGAEILGTADQKPKNDKEGDKGSA